MDYVAVGLIGVMVIAAVLLRLPRRRPPAPRWVLAARRGPLADFSCGHRVKRYAAFSCGRGDPEKLFVRKIPRWMAKDVPCPDCILARLAGKRREEAAGFEGLVPVKDALAEIAARKKNRPI